MNGLGISVAYRLVQWVRRVTWISSVLLTHCTLLCSAVSHAEPPSLSLPLSRLFQLAPLSIGSRMASRVSYAYLSRFS